MSGAIHLQSTPYMVKIGRSKVNAKAANYLSYWRGKALEILTPGMHCSICNGTRQMFHRWFLGLDQCLRWDRMITPRGVVQ